MRAITVCVDYEDYLAITLPRNQKFFQHILVVVSLKTGFKLPSHLYDASVVSFYATDAFYRNAAIFNKGLAIEEAFDRLGREGWFCILDADIVLPKAFARFSNNLDRTALYTPKRRMLDGVDWTETALIPDQEERWSEFPVNPEQEFPGYCQVFHASNPNIRNCRPWYSTDWIHAGGCDSDFQSKFQKKIRPEFECLHLGPAQRNWCGRSTAYLDGSLPQKSAERADVLDKILRDRREFGNSHERFGDKRNA